MTDDSMGRWNAYKEAPKKVLGMTLKEAEAHLLANDFVYGIASVDGIGQILPAVVMIHLYVADGKVVKTALDGDTFELEP